MKDISYPKLKSECARLGLSAKGTKVQLSERMDRFLRGDEQQKQFTAEDDNSHIAPNEIVVANPEKQQDQVLSVNEYDDAEMRHKADWDSLKIKLDLIFAGRVQFFLQTNSPNNYSVVFKGTAKRSECINLTAGHKTIERIAMSYVGNNIQVAPPTGGDTPDMAMERLAKSGRT